MNPGDIFFLKDFPLYFGDPKDTVFIYIGEIEQDAVIVLSVKTTSQKGHYDPGGSRADHPIIRYQEGQYGFKKETIIDLTDKVYEIEIDRVDTGIKFESIPKQDVGKIFNSMSASKKYPRVLIKKLYDDLMAHHVPGLIKPK